MSRTSKTARLVVVLIAVLMLAADCVWEAQ